MSKRFDLDVAEGLLLAVALGLLLYAVVVSL